MSSAVGASPSQSRLDHDRSRLNIWPLQKQTLKAGLRQKQTQQPEDAESHRLAGALFDMACIEFGEKNQALGIRIAEALGMDNPISESLIARWRKADARERPNLTQMMALGSEFNRIFRKHESRHRGWGKRALLDLVEAVEAVAEVG